jgi:hypothetical protein
MFFGRKVMMNRETFQSLSRDKVAQLVREAGSKVCVFPPKGTRRWFMLEYPAVSREGFAAVYLDVALKRSIELYQLIFAHGVHTLLVPLFDKLLMERGEAYMQMAVDALTRLATHADFLDFYEAYKVRVRFYGHHREFLGSTPYAYLSDLFDQVTAQTLAHDQNRLFFGVCPHNTVEATAALVARYYGEHGRVPDRRTLVERYYGEYVAPVDLFIGFGKLRTFGAPLLTTGREDLYFTVSPSLYLTERQLRDILYDHLYARIRTKADLQPDDWALMRDFYQANVGRTLGIGQQNGSVWRPLPQVR